MQQFDNPRKYVSVLGPYATARNSHSFQDREPTQNGRLDSVPLQLYFLFISDSKSYLSGLPRLRINRFVIVH